MKKFLDDNFLLQTETAAYLYHEYASGMPIIDYHCHLQPAQIAENKNFGNITQAWLYGDHYKWRAMRTNGISERYCTGKASDREKFQKWAETVPYTIRNPLFHWTHLELLRYFGIIDLLNPQTAAGIYEKTQNMLQEDEYRPVGLIKKMNVELVCTTDDPVDGLEHHHQLKKNKAPFKVIPAWRPDKALAVSDPKAYNEYIDSLSRVSDVDIVSYSRLIDALNKRHEYFHANGCRLSDHGLETFYTESYTAKQINVIFERIRNGNSLSHEETVKFRTAMLFDLAVMDHDKGWTQQFHIGALRNNNSRMYRSLGPDTGFDSIGDLPVAKPMSHFFDKLDKDNKLAKTIIYNLNPADNEVIATMLGNFQDGSIPGKMQWGSGWWFLDQKDGMEKHLNALSNHGLLSRFIGMLTDSRSFLSYPRHEYFRRILCNLIGGDVERGELPNDKKFLGGVIQNICYYNAKKYFDF
jgi:glucuronate isomerase